MVLPNLPPIRISIDDVREHLRSEREAQQPAERENAEPAPDDVIGWRRTWQDPNDHSKGRICEPVTYAEYLDIQEEMNAPQEEAEARGVAGDDDAG